MKILLIDNFHYRRGGAEVVYLNTADLLKKHGHNVVFFSQKWDSNLLTSDSVYFPQGYSVQDKGFTNKLKCIRNYFYNRDAERSLSKLIEAEKPDVAHIHLFWGGLSPSIYKTLKRYNIPIVHSVHDYRMICPGYTLKDGKDKLCERCKGGRFYECFLNKCSKGNIVMSAIMSLEMYLRNYMYHPAEFIDQFLYVSKFSRDKHLVFDKKFSKVKSEVLYNFTNNDVLQSKDVQLDTYNNYYLYYGRLSFEKGVETLIKAFSRFPELHLKIVGTGPLEDKLKQLCKRLSISNIEFLGFKSGRELYSLISNAKFVCVPSEWYENNPMTIIESYSLRSPVIGSAIGGILEIVNEGITGFTFQSGNVDSLCEALNKSTSISEYDYMKMKNEADLFACNNFNGDSYCERLINIYRGLLGK